MIYDDGIVRTCAVICRCRKRLDSFKEWERHLHSRHPRLYQELKANGDLELDRLEFARRHGSGR